MDKKWEDLESEFMISYLEENKKAPTYAEAIKWASERMIEKSCDFLASVESYENINSEEKRDFFLAAYRIFM